METDTGYLQAQGAMQATQVQFTKTPPAVFGSIDCPQKGRVALALKINVHHHSTGPVGFAVQLLLSNGNDI
jgi:hypothetical protein